jgi:uncharacterized Zn finger protein
MMPDLDIKYVQVCSETLKTAKVLSSKGDKHYEVTASLDEQSDRCTCPGFGYRRKCRHVDELRSTICGWDEQHSDEVQTPQQEMEGVCPKCGGETTVIKVAV